MKEHILPKQAKQLTKEEFYRLNNDMVSRDDWANYHHKKITVGKMIVFINQFDRPKIYFGLNTSYWHVELLDQSQSFVSKELVDALFNALLWIIKNQEIIREQKG